MESAGNIHQSLDENSAERPLSKMTAGSSARAANALSTPGILVTALARGSCDDSARSGFSRAGGPGRGGPGAGRVAAALGVRLAESAAGGPADDRRIAGRRDPPRTPGAGR